MESLVEEFDRVLPGAFLHLVEGRMHGPLGEALLPAFHDFIDQPVDDRTTIDRI